MTDPALMGYRSDFRGDLALLTALADGVTPDGIRSYLSGNGWAQGGGDMETMFQPNPEAHDYARRLRMMLHDLAAVEGRSPLMILRDLRRASTPDSEDHQND